MLFNRVATLFSIAASLFMGLNIRALRSLIATLLVVGWCTLARAQSASSYQQTNLVSDGSITAANTDPTLINGWGIAIGQNTPFWVNSQGGGVSEVYDAAGKKQFDVGIPGKAGSSTAGHPTGIVFNSSSTDFVLSNGLAATFLFATTDGTIAGWNANFTNAVGAVDNSSAGAVYTGLALVNNGSANMLLAANFGKGTVDVFNKTFATATLAGNFSDTTLPAGYAPYGIHVLKNQVFIDYALQRPGGGPPLKGAGNGIVDVFDMTGILIKRVATGGTLNAPWAATLAPAGFGTFGGTLLIGNFGDGTINAFDANSFAFKGQLKDASGSPIVNSGLWDMTFGQNGVGDPNTLYFSAGPNGEKSGLFGAISLTSAGAPGGDFALIASPTTLSVTAGQSVTVTVNVSPLMGFSAPVTFTCSGTPPGTSCLFAPSTVTPTGGAMASTTMTVSTNMSTPIGIYGMTMPPQGTSRELLFSVVSAVLIGMGWFGIGMGWAGLMHSARRKRIVGIGAVVGGILLLAMMSACGSGMSGSGPNISTPTGTGQMMTITATSGSLSHSIGVTMTVH
jgi:uncharacterized protein (TIGR03118 family)